MKRAGKFWVPDEEEIQLKALADGGWQLDHLDRALAHVKDFGIAIDGGAHVGSWTMRMAEKFKQVHAFEPSPPTYECLNANMSEWGAAHKDIDVFIALHKCALGEAAGMAGMGEDGKYSNGGNTGGRYLLPGIAGTIRVRSLDSFGLAGCDFLKLDVEGFELYALQGARAVIEEFRPIVQIEVKHRMAQRYGLAADRAGLYLRKLGMRIIDKIGSDEVWGWY